MTNKTDTVEETTEQRLEREISTREGERINAQFKQGVISPMELAKFMGVRPQMVYQDIRSGRLKAVKQNNTQKLVISRHQAVAYAAAYLDRKAARLLQQAAERAAIEEATQGAA